MAESHRPNVVEQAAAWRDSATSYWRRNTANVTREQVISNLKTLAWVVPLTLLIWIYAEREQVATTKDVAAPFELVSVDPGRVVSLARATQDRNFILELQGPQARLQEVIQKLRSDLPHGLKIEIPP